MIVSNQPLLFYCRKLNTMIDLCINAEVGYNFLNRPLNWGYCLQEFDICVRGIRCQKYIYIKEICTTKILHVPSSALRFYLMCLCINCSSGEFSVRWNIFSWFLLKLVVGKNKMFVLDLGNLWTFSNKSFTRVALIHFYLKTCSLFSWDLYFILVLTIAHNTGVETLMVRVDSLNLVNVRISVASALQYNSNAITLVQSLLLD